MNKRSKIYLAAMGVMFITLCISMGISIWLFVQEKRAVQLREYEKFLQDEGGDKNGISLEYQEDEKRKLLALQKEILGKGSQEVADTLAELSDLLLAEKNFPEAESAARESIAAYKKTSDYGQFRYNGILATLSKILWQENKMAEAEDVARESVAELKKRDTGEMGSPDRLYAGLGLLAAILWDEGKSAEAQAVYDEGFKVQSDFYKAAQIREQEQKIQLEQAQQAAPTNQQVQSSEQYVFRHTNVVQIIPNWGNLIDPEGGSIVKSTNRTLSISIPGTIHQMGRLIAQDIVGSKTNSIFYTGREIQILQEIKGDFTVQVKVLCKYERESKTEYNDINIFTSAGLLLLDGTNNIHFCSDLLWSDEFQTLEAPFVSLYYHLSSYKEKYASPYTQLEYPNYLEQFVIGHGFDGKFSYLRMSRSGQMLKLAISRDGIGWLEMFTLPLPPSEKVVVGLEASHNSHNTATVEFSEFKLTHSAVP